MLATTIGLAAGLVLLFTGVSIRRRKGRTGRPLSTLSSGYVSQEWLTDHMTREPF
jgi:hypothetical protein